MAPNNDFEENQKRIEGLRKMIRQEVDAILNGPNKRAVTPAEMIPQAEIIQHDGSAELIGISEISEAFSKDADKLINDIYTGESFDDNLQKCIIELVHNEVFDRSEISNENVEGLTNAFLAMQSNLARIRAARLKGNFSYEQPFYQAEHTSYPRTEIANPQEISKKLEVKELFLSKLIETYCETKIKDGAWTRRALSDHRNRVVSLLRIIGDKPIGDITRQDMRKFRNTLQSLPPRWNALVEKSGFSIEEFVKQGGYKTTLSIKSINITVEATSGMFSWAIREILLIVTPHKVWGSRIHSLPLKKSHL